MEYENRIYTEYDIFYDLNENRTHVVARFRLDGPKGSLLKLADSTGAYVKFNEDDLIYNIWYGGHHKSYPGRIEKGLFTYRNGSMTIFKNEVPEGSELAFPITIDPIKKAQDQFIFWQGDPIKESEKIGLFIGAWNWGEKAKFSSEELGSVSLELRSEELSMFETGSATLFMDRSNTQNITEGTPAGGRVRNTYRGMNRIVVIEE